MSEEIDLRPNHFTAWCFTMCSATGSRDKTVTADSMHWPFAQHMQGVVVREAGSCIVGVFWSNPRDDMSKDETPVSRMSEAGV